MYLHKCLCVVRTHESLSVLCNNFYRTNARMCMLHTLTHTQNEILHMLRVRYATFDVRRLAGALSRKMITQKEHTAAVIYPQNVHNVHIFVYHQSTTRTRSHRVQHTTHKKNPPSLPRERTIAQRDTAKVWTPAGPQLIGPKSIFWVWPTLMTAKYTCLTGARAREPGADILYIKYMQHIILNMLSVHRAKFAFRSSRRACTLL